MAQVYSRTGGRTRMGRVNLATEKAAVAQAAKRKIILQDDGDETAPEPVVRSRQSARQPVREPARAATGRVVARGRDGEMLTRKRTAGTDAFEVPKEIIPEGWAYQWNAITVTGNAEVLADQNLMMSENGWRPVPADRHPGRFMPVGHKGAIIRGGCRLEERPEILSQEAREEELLKAKQLITDRNESLKLTGLKKQMGHGFEMGNKYRGSGGDVRISIDHGADVPRPQHKLADTAREE